MEVRFDNISEELQHELDKEMDILIDDIFVMSQENLLSNGSVDTGQLLQSGLVVKEFLEKKIIYDAPQAPWIEFGTNPHPVSDAGIANLAKWARRKLGLSPKEAMKAAHAIAWKIRREGMDPRPFLRPAAEAKAMEVQVG